MEQVVKEERRRENRTENGGVEPTDRQKLYIKALAQASGMTVDVSQIGNRQKATRMIESLKLLCGRMNGTVVDTRERRAAFGMATKLVFVSHAGRERDLSKWNRKQFWGEVLDFYAEFVQQQELAVVGNRME